MAKAWKPGGDKGKHREMDEPEGKKNPEGKSRDTVRSTEPDSKPKHPLYDRGRKSDG